MSKHIWKNDQLYNDIVKRQKYLFKKVIGYISKMKFETFPDLQIFENPRDAFHILYPNVYLLDDDVRRKCNDNDLCFINANKCHSNILFLHMTERLIKIEDEIDMNYVKCDGIVKVNLIFRSSIWSRVWVHKPETPIKEEYFIEDTYDYRQ